jgi:hypothetical protein
VHCGLVGIDSGGSAEHYFAGMKKRVFLGACLMALASQPVKAQTGGLAAVVVVQIYQSTLNKGRIVVERGVDKPEIVEFKFSPQDEQAAAYQHIFAKLAQEGYVLKSTFSVQGGGATTLGFGRSQ